MIIGRQIVGRRKKNDFRLAGARKKTGDGELRLSESPVNPSEKADIFLCQSSPKTGNRRRE
jgi:hypothetical protein